jgi:hypothetical protein
MNGRLSREEVMSSSASTINISAQKADLQAQYTALMKGITDGLAGVDSFVFRKVTYTRLQLLAELQSVVDAANAGKVARAAFQVAVAKGRAVLANVAPVRAGVKTYLQSRFGKDAPELQSFGFAPAKKPARTVASKAKAIAQAQATCKARHTVGSKVKKTIKGTVATADSASSAAHPIPAPTGATTGGHGPTAS